MSFSFGTPSSAPASSGLSSGFSFGAAKPATPGFGFGSTATTSAPAFGAATAFGASTTGFGGNTSTPAFGAGATSTPAFGASSGFGASATPAFGASTTPAFGATSTAPTFGAATATPAFGATSTAPAFGSTSAAPAFGSTTTPAFGATATPAFGATTTPAFGATSQPAFGATTTPAFGQTSAPSFGGGLGTGGLNFGAGTSTASTGLSFGTPATAANTGLGGLGGFGFGAAATTQSGFGFGATTSTTNSLFGAKLGATTASGLQTSTTATPSLGLGGLSQSGIGTANTTTGDGKSEPPKQTKLPNELLTDVESFKEFVKKQKSLSSDIMRVSIKPLHKVSSTAESTLRQALSLSGELGRARAVSARLRASAAAALAHTETTARDALGTELEGVAPPAYIKELITELEQQIVTFRRQMEVADKQMQSSPKLLTEQELNLGIRRMHESLVALAGRLQAVHTQVEAQKEQYLNLRKYVLKDSTDVFNSVSASHSLDQILRDAEGTRKKTKSGLNDSLGRAVLSDPRAALGSIAQLAGPTPFSYLGNSFSPFPGADNSGGSSWQPGAAPTRAAAAAAPAAPAEPGAGAGFQLQKPPGKRGKQ
ncbi:nuclear pore complex protein Nup58-like [Cydia pomonella]|uniref:nuclear pore complex protein Nup58-like n=1 Tax=Cydia pomonella TaxID=82600 RepID=UPI002ADDBD13|nr:nuclear pore complex protein Nup58-like [Cydia pomonella]